MTEIPVAHIDDEGSVRELARTLRSLHGPSYSFDLFRWANRTELSAPVGSSVCFFVARSDDAAIRLQPRDRVRGGIGDDVYRHGDDGLSSVTKHHLELLWPGDVFTVGPDTVESLRLYGKGVAFRIVVEASAYVLPRLALLRNLLDKPGGCAAYAGAFRREALPPDRSGTSEDDARGANRVNEHTLDMRVDRDLRWSIARLLASTQTGKRLPEQQRPVRC